MSIKTSRRYSYAIGPTEKKSRSSAPQYHQNISEAKYLGTSRESVRVLFILKKLSNLNFENPLFNPLLIDSSCTQTPTTYNIVVYLLFTHIQHIVRTLAVMK